MHLYVIHKRPHALNGIVLFGFLYFWGLLWPWKLTFTEHWRNFLSNFVSLVTYLSYSFLLDGCIFTTDEEKERKNQFFNYFWKMLLKFEEKKLRIEKLSQFSITWILKKLRSMYKPLLKTFQKSNYLTGTFWAKPI